MPSPKFVKKLSLKTVFRISYFILLASLLITSCNTIDLYEKTVSIPGHAWKSSYKPSFTFTIKDTSAPYRVILVLRHTQKYSYTNIWLNVSVKLPGTDSAIVFKADKKLANNDNGWLGTGMDDIYEHRIELTDELINNNVSFRRKGDYIFTLEQIMREDPLKNVLNAGLRIEKITN
jgi:gliding motility-associated lipoprotein GldH